MFSLSLKTELVPSTLFPLVLLLGADLNKNPHLEAKRFMFVCLFPNVMLSPDGECWHRKRVGVGLVHEHVLKLQSQL